MKICFFYDTVFAQGGVARVITTLANELSKEHEITIICTNKSYSVNSELYKLNIDNINIIINEIELNLFERINKKILRYINKNIKIFNIRTFRNIYLNNLFSKRNRKKFSELLNQGQFDVIIPCHGWHTIYCCLMKDNLNSKVIGWQHNSYSAYFNEKNEDYYYWNMEEIFKENFSKLDMNVVLSNDDKLQYREKLGLECICIYNPNCFTTNQYTTLSNKVFLAVGRLVKQKGFDNLIEAFYKFSKLNDEWSLVIVGEGSEFNNLSSLIKKYNLEKRVKIYGFTKNIEKYYLKSDVYILSSRWEGWGLVWIEAMTYGLPLITFELPACKEVIKENDLGYMVENQNVEKLAEAMLKIVSDKKRLKHQSRNAIQFSKAFSSNEIVKQWENIIKSNIK